MDSDMDVALPSFPLLTLSRDDEMIVVNPNQGWAVLPGIEGFDDPVRTLSEIVPALGDGSFVTYSRFATREVFIPLHYSAATTADLRTGTKKLAGLCNPKLGLVTLRVAHKDGTARTIEGYSSAPMGTALKILEGGMWRNFGVTLRCPDPFWLSGESTTLHWSLGSEVKEFLSEEFLPMGVNNSQITGGVNIDNAGDAEAYPVWEIRGPCDSVEVVVGTDTYWTIPAGLLETETLIINAVRGVKTCTIDGESAWGRLGPGAKIGTLPPGRSTLTVTAVSAGSTSSIKVQWRERWLTAW